MPGERMLWYAQASGTALVADRSRLRFALDVGRGGCGVAARLGEELRRRRRLGDGVGACEGSEACTGFGEVGDHRGRGRGCRRAAGARAAATVVGGEAVVEQLGDDAAAGDEVGHGDGEIAVVRRAGRGISAG